MSQKIYTTYVSSCDECPAYNYTAPVCVVGVHWCDNLDKEILGDEIPDDCPLEDC